MENSQDREKPTSLRPLVNSEVESATPINLDDSPLPSVEYAGAPELDEAREAVLTALQEEPKDPARIGEAWDHYARVGEHLVDQIETSSTSSDKRAEAQVALILHKALIFQQAGHMNRYVEELDYAHTYADNMNFQELATLIRKELDALIETQELSPELLLVKLKGEISELNREHLRDLLLAGDDLEDTINNAWNILEDEGKDADEVLTRLGILEA